MGVVVWEDKGRGRADEYRVGGPILRGERTLLYSEFPVSPATRERAVPVIAVENLVKRFRKIEALKGVSLTVERGEIFGLLGQNGAGKTTLIKILLGVISKTEGEARLLDQRAGTPSVRRRVGYL